MEEDRRDLIRDLRKQALLLAELGLLGEEVWGLF